MSEQSSGIKQFEEKINAQMRESKARLDALEARAKEKNAQAEIATINNLKAKKQEINAKLQDLKKSGEAKAAQVKPEIDADVAKIKAALDQLSSKLGSDVRAKAS